MRLKIPYSNTKIRNKFKEYYDNIKYYTEIGEREKVKKIMNKIDDGLYKYFGLSDKEIQTVKSI